MDTLFLENAYNNKFSVEFFPLKNQEKYPVLIETIKTYESLGIKCINITCKAQNQENTLQAIKIIQKHTDMIIIPHIAAYTLTHSELDTYLQEYSDMGIRNILAIRGDKDDNPQSKPDFLYAADLVKKIKQWAGAEFSVGVAGYPEGHFEEPNCLFELQYLKEKMDAGADYIITQLFFENSYFYDFVHKCKIFDITIPILPGITYLKNKEHMTRLATMMQGATLPAQLLEDIYSEKETCGSKWLYTQVEDLLANNFPVHLYTFNDIGPMADLIKQFN